MSTKVRYEFIEPLEVNSSFGVFASFVDKKLIKEEELMENVVTAKLMAFDVGSSTN
jgi:hypothetical protein